MIRALLFDADDTFYEEKHAKVAGETAVAQQAAKMIGIETASAFHMFKDAKRSVMQSMRGNPLRVESTLWMRAFAQAVHLPETATQELTDTYWNAVLSELRPYADTQAVLPLLAQKFTLLVATNEIRTFAERKLEKTGFLPFIAHVVSASDIGAEKPDVKLFSAALRLAGISPGETAMIGNDPRTDIAGANASGIVSIFLKRGPFTRYAFHTQEETPLYTIDDFFDLLKLLPTIQ